MVEPWIPMAGWALAGAAAPHPARQRAPGPVGSSPPDPALPRRPELKPRTSLRSLSNSPPPSLRCGEDLCFGFTDFQQLSQCKTDEMRKFRLAPVTQHFAPARHLLDEAVNGRRRTAGSVCLQFFAHEDDEHRFGGRTVLAHGESGDHCDAQRDIRRDALLKQR